VFFITFQTQLDFYFVKKHFSDISIIFTYYFLHLFLLVVISLANSFVVCEVYKARIMFSRKLKYIIFIALTSLIVVPQFISSDFNNELIVFAGSIYNNDKIIDYYQNFYHKLIQKSIKENKYIISQAENINRDEIPSFLDNIIILQIESLNGFLVNEKITPNFMLIAREGIFFPKFYSNSVHTIFAQENILCSLPSSFHLDLAHQNASRKILSLPEVLNHIGYKTFFFKSYDLNFAKTGTLMRNLRFDEVHADDIMKNGDAEYPWGYKEDIFFKRVFDYIEKNKNEKYNFFYIEIGPTNHWPFYTPLEFKNTVPYNNPRNHQEKLSNTIYLQDQYLQLAWEKINRIFPDKNYTLLILGDHSWPAELHVGNNFNCKGSYEENFMTAMAVIVGNEQKYKCKTINTKYSQMDIMPSILDLLNINFPRNKYSQSFFHEVNNNEQFTSHEILLIQPFYERSINLILNNHLKYQYNATEQHIALYDLEKDPQEINGTIISDNKKNNIDNIKKLLPILESGAKNHF
jgi:arylsulfatase A-like enzyme